MPSHVFYALLTTVVRPAETHLLSAVVTTATTISCPVVAVISALPSQAVQPVVRTSFAAGIFAVALVLYL